MIKKPKPTDIDLEISKKIRQFRKEKGLSQRELATASNISFQQLQKYEYGKNRVSCGRLWLIAKTLDLPVEVFFPSR